MGTDPTTDAKDTSTDRQRIDLGPLVQVVQARRHPGYVGWPLSNAGAPSGASTSTTGARLRDGAIAAETAGAVHRRWDHTTS